MTTSELKKAATDVLNSAGYDYDTALEMFHRWVIFEGKLPPMPTDEPQPLTEETAKSCLSLIDDLVASGKIGVTRIDVNEKGEWLIDKDEHPDIYDWMVNG